MNRKLAVLLTIAIPGLLLIGCPATVKPDPQDSSKPTVEIKVRKPGDPDFVAKSTYDSTLANEPFDIVCEVKDLQGVRSVKLSFTGTQVDNCQVDGDDQELGSMTLPAEEGTTLQGNSNGQVLTKLSHYANLGPFQCKHFQQVGRPVDHTVTAHCSGTNWGSQNNFAKTDLAINIK